MDTVEPKSKRTAVIFPRQRKMLNILGENLTLAMKRRGITQEMMHSAYSVLLEQPFRFYLNTSDQRIVG